MKPESLRLREVVFTRNARGNWDVLRKRDETGEVIGGCINLEAAMAAVLIAYDKHGCPLDQHMTTDTSTEEKK